MSWVVRQQLKRNVSGGLQREPIENVVLNDADPILKCVMKPKSCVYQQYGQNTTHYFSRAVHRTN
jgi:hypothetical protein